MNASKHGTNALRGWWGAAKVCSECVRRTQPELHTFLLLQYTSAMAVIVNINGDAVARLFKRWTPPSMVPMHFLDGEELPKLCSKCVCRTQPELHTFWLLQYTSAMAATVNLLNINGDAAARLFERWTPPSMVPLHFLDGEELPKICYKCVRRTQPELHTFLLLQYTSAMAATVNLLNINGDACARLFEQWTPPSMVSMHFLDGEELPKICSKCVRRTQPEQHTFLLLQYTSAMAAIVSNWISMGMLLPGCSNDECHQAL